MAAISVTQNVSSRNRPARGRVALQAVNVIAVVAAIAVTVWLLALGEVVLAILLSAGVACTVSSLTGRS